MKIRFTTMRKREREREKERERERKRTRALGTAWAFETTKVTHLQ